MPGLIILVIAFLSAAVATPLVRRAAVASGAVDRPDGGRKTHSGPMPLLGGFAVFAALAVATCAAVALGYLPGEHIKEKFLVGILLAAALLVFGGALDDRLNLRPAYQLVWPCIAALVIIGSGIGVTYITNPFGGQIFLDRYIQTVLWWQGIPYKVTFLADAFTFVWLMGMTYTTKLLDGVDGLVPGITAIGALVIAAVSVTREVSQPDTAILALAVAGAFIGFLIFNFHPASIFLGEGGSTLAGFLLGTLAIVSGGKIATALLVLGLPIFDTAAVIIRRVFIEKKSMASADRSHLHLRLRDLGFGERQIVLFYWFTAASFGVSTLALHGWEKVAALAFAASVLVAATAVAIAVLRKRAAANTPRT